ncbi:MAG: hypothetical protein A2Z20_04030 [Bdellovibrionales bacterium RBG_16_40_8]|nr:MAG: hypothetical protein A2Z20_04030 [Bdellovibrionales bacterium RBG_16_40_8]
MKKKLLLLSLWAFLLLAGGYSLAEPEEVKGAPKKSVKKTKVVKSIAKDKTKSKTKKSRINYYISAVESYQFQGNRELQTATDDIYEISDFKGLSTFFSFGGEYLFGNGLVSRAGLIFRRIELKGEAAPISSGSKNIFLLKQDFIGLETGLRYKPKGWGAWSLMGGLEYSRGQKIELNVLEGPNVNTDNPKKSVYIVASTSLLYARNLGSGFYIEPALRMGAVMTMVPFIFLTEAVITLKKGTP